MASLRSPSRFRSFGRVCTGRVAWNHALHSCGPRRSRRIGCRKPRPSPATRGPEGTQDTTAAAETRSNRLGMALTAVDRLALGVAHRSAPHGCGLAPPGLEPLLAAEVPEGQGEGARLPGHSSPLEGRGRVRDDPRATALVSSAVQESQAASQTHHQTERHHHPADTRRGPRPSPTARRTEWLHKPPARPAWSQGPYPGAPILRPMLHCHERTHRPVPRV
jgi:hypothetical protein